MIEHSITVTITPRTIVECNKMLHASARRQPHFLQSPAGKAVTFFVLMLVFAASFILLDFVGGIDMDSFIYFLAGLCVGVFLMIGILLLMVRKHEKSLPTIEVHYTFREEDVLIELEDIVARYHWAAYDHVICGNEFWLLVHRNWTKQYHMLEVACMSEELQDMIRSKLRNIWVETNTTA